MKPTILKRRRLIPTGLAVALAGVLFPLCVDDANAQQDYPTSVVTIVVPFPPGGGVDTLARLIGPSMSERLGQPVVIENKPGAGSLIGAEAVRKSKADGYTLLMGSTSFVSNVILGERKPYDPQADFAPVTLVGSVPNVLVGYPGIPFKDINALVAAAKAKPDSIKYASYGDRSTPHLAAQLFEIAADIKMTHVPYRGGAPALTAVLGGEVDVGFSSVVPVIPHIREGSVKPLAVAWEKRLSILPDVPTFKESGVDMELGTWFGVLAPAGTPKPIVDRLNREIGEVLGEPTAKDYLAKIAMEVLAYGPADFAKFLEKDIKVWKNLAARSARP